MLEKIKLLNYKCILCTGMGLEMNEEDKNKFFKDFKKVDVPKKLDMWYFALEQETLWDEILTEMSEFANKQNIVKK